MKQTIGRTLTLVFVAGLLFAGGARAQQVDHIIKVNIPFEFSVRGKTFPAGQYSVVRDSSFLQVRDAQGRILMTVLTNAVQSSRPFSSPKLEFEAHDGRPALVRVWQRGEYGNELSGAKRVARVAKQRNADVEAAETGSHP